MKTHLNLMPSTALRRQMIQRRLFQWSIVWLTLAATATAIGGFKLANIQSLANHLMYLEQEYAPTKKLQSQLPGLRQNIKEFDQEESLALALADRRPILAVLGFVSRAAADCKGNIYVNRMAVEPQSHHAKPTHLNMTTTLLKLEGLAIDNVAVSEFATALRQNGHFRQVELKSTGDYHDAQVPVRTYVVECTF